VTGHDLNKLDMKQIEYAKEDLDLNIDINHNDLMASLLF